MRLSSQPKRSCNEDRVEAPSGSVDEANQFLPSNAAGSRSDPTYATGSPQGPMGRNDHQRSESPSEHIPNVDLPSSSMSNQVDDVQFSCESGPIIESLLTGISPCEPVLKDAITRPVRGRAKTSAERMRALRERRRNAPSELSESEVSALVGTSGTLTNLQNTVPTIAPNASRHGSDLSRSGSFNQTWVRASIQF